MTGKDKALIEEWLATQRARPQARAMRTAGFSANKVLKPFHKKHGGKGAPTIRQVAADWPHFAGRFAKLSRPVRVSGTKEGRTLHVEAAGPAAGLLQADAGNIVARIRARLGSRSVDAIRVSQGRVDDRIDVPTPERGLTPSEEAKLQSGLSGVEDEGLKAALEALGRNVLKKGNP